MTVRDANLYRLQAQALRDCVEHLQSFDLDELLARSRQHGSESDRAIIQAVRDALPGIPPARHRE